MEFQYILIIDEYKALKEYVSKNLFIKDSPWIDIYNPEAQKTHWNAYWRNYFF